jgi:ribosome-binding protein aMBF1 (putative translation factor)
VQARGSQIRGKREACGLSLTQLAEQAGISVSWLSRIESDQANPSPAFKRGRNLMFPLSAVEAYEASALHDRPLTTTLAA